MFTRGLSMKLFGALALTLSLAFAAEAQPKPSVSGAWSRPAVAAANGVGYMTVTNPRTTADALVRVETPLAARVEMHSSSMAGGVMSMKKLERVAVPARGHVAFAPGGSHLMLIGLTRTLGAGDKVPATLTFASGAKVQTTFAVGVTPPLTASKHAHR
jgi:copper(I)-binding protein